MVVMHRSIDITAAVFAAYLNEDEESGRAGPQKAHNRHRLLLRTSARTSVIMPPAVSPARGDHSITSSARARIAGGTAKPRSRAVLRFTISSNLAGCWTGRSAGLVPLRILPT